ncbi:hypothetical protein [Parasitella parasitica]|uniref:XPG-I domain-containing protein n=1 Tax=Parasitella parasitica TaxID=35722 RepID=A0A0B7NFJ2_9FUNG|nr:hypothetical protein [Parasitella parasitica]
MGVSGTWSFLNSKDIKGVKSNDIQRYSERVYFQKTIHIDLVGAFYNSIRRNFLNVREKDERKKLSAAHRLLAEIHTVVNKKNCILYIDGKPTLERDFAHTNRLESLLSTQETLEKEIEAYNESHTKARHKTIMFLARKLFRVSPDIESTIVYAAQQTGWRIVVAEGEAEVEIGRVGGIVLTQDSDMLFYPKVDTVICPFDGAYRFYNKSTILSELGLSNEFFTVMGIVAKNDYDQDFYAEEKSENDRDFHKNRMNEIYKELVVIEKESFNVRNLTGSSLIKVILKAYVSFMNAKTGKDVGVDAYQSSYSIFALQQEQPLLEAYDPRSYDINRPATYLDMIHNYQPRYDY